jgi:predicted RNA-binding Zn ribbon-like protein
VPAAESRVASVRLVGGRPCVDLVNTVSWRFDPARHEEHLRAGPDALTWLGRVAVLDPAEVEALRGDADAVLAGLVGVRTALTPYVDAVVDEDGGALAARALPAELQDGIREAVRHAELRPSPDGHRWIVTGPQPRTPVRRILLDLHELLARPGARLGRCADDDCGWAFHDTGRRGARRWCSSADCGNRHRVRRHYARTRRPG